MKKTTTMLLAGGVGSRLNVLAKLRAKPAVPFGGIFRIIDFTLSNVMNSGLDHVGILTQYQPFSLMKHIGTGAPWDFVG
ncbi:MAG TPA: sugar phosphate nucleotidyltransferase, partial [bacterium]